MESSTSVRVCWQCCGLELGVSGRDSGYPSEPVLRNGSRRSASAVELSARQSGKREEAVPEAEAVGWVRALVSSPRGT